MNKKARLKLIVSLSIALVLAMLLLLSTRSKAYQILELKALDLRFALKGDRNIKNSPILHVDIDDQSLAAIGRWPWPRYYHAQLTSILKECQAKQILMDVLFTEEFKDDPAQDVRFATALSETKITYLPFYFIESNYKVDPGLRPLLLEDITLSAKTAAQALGVDIKVINEQLPIAKKALLNEVIHTALAKEPDLNEEGLLQKLEEINGWFLFPEDEAYILSQYQDQKSSRMFQNKFFLDVPVQGWPFNEEYRQLRPPIMAYTANIKGSGFINADPDQDGVTRRIPLFLKHEQKIVPQLTVAALMEWLNVKTIAVNNNHIILKNADFNGTIKDISIPVDRSGSMLVNWAGRWGASFEHIPYNTILALAQVREQLALELDKTAQNKLTGDSGIIDYLKKTETELVEKLTGMVKGRICIIGLTATGTNDLHPIPLQENYPMVGTHSNVINTILSQDFIMKKDGFVRLLIFILTALVIAASSLIKLWKSLLLSFGFAAAYFLVALFVFIKFGIWIDMVGPLGIVVFGFALITSYRFFTEEKEKLWIKQAFSHYLSNEVISELMDDPSRLKLGGERRVITVLFSDIRGFTAFSESRQPEEVVSMLNEILGEQVEVLFRHNGTLDKFVGDELMAFFGAPGNQHLHNHALIAVQVAIEIQAKMRDLQANRIKENKNPLQIGIGINTGEMVVGNMGSTVRMDYTVIGDNVNLAARLCSVAGKDEVIISGATYDLVAEHVHAEKLDPVAVKGKSNPIPIYRVTGLKDQKDASAGQGNSPA